MTWFRIDDSFGTHPKVLGIPRKDRPTAVGLWTLAGVYAANHLTDGHIASHMLDELGVPKRFAAILVSARLWHVPSDQCEVCEDQGTLPVADGFQFHDWFRSQPSRAKVEQTRREDAERKAAARAAKRSGSQQGDGAERIPTGIPYDLRAVRP